MKKSDKLLEEFFESQDEQTELLKGRATDFDQLCKEVAAIGGKVDDVQHSLDEKTAHDERIERFYAELHQIATNAMESSVAETRKMAQDLGGVIAAYQRKSLDAYDALAVEQRKQPDYLRIKELLEELNANVKQLLITGAIATQAA